MLTFSVVVEFWGRYMVLLLQAENEDTARQNAASFLSEVSVLAPFGFLHARTDIDPQYFHVAQLTPNAHGVLTVEVQSMEDAIDNPNFQP